MVRLFRELGNKCNRTIKAYRWWRLGWVLSINWYNRKAWQLANYKSVDEIERENCGSEIVIFNQDRIVREIALIDEEAVDHYLAEDNILDDELEEDT